MANGGLQLPPGFRFHPTDEELVAHYLCRKCANHPISVPVITDLDLYKFDPWKLPERAMSGEKEWYFFSPRDRKYPNGSRPNRAAGTGYWKATGADKPIGKPKTMGIKKALVFYAGKPPKGVKTNWIMHEYRLANVDRSAGNNSGLRLDDWVLCRIYNKKGSLEEEHTFDRKSMKNTELEDQKPVITTCVESGLEAIKAGSDLLHFDTSESVPRCHTTDSSGSEHAVSTGNVKCDMEVQSALDFGFNYEEPFGLDSFNQSFGYNHQQDHLSSWQDMYMYIT